MFNCAGVDLPLWHKIIHQLKKESGELGARSGTMKTCATGANHILHSRGFARR